MQLSGGVISSVFSIIFVDALVVFAVAFLPENMNCRCAIDIPHGNYSVFDIFPQCFCVYFN